MKKTIINSDRTVRRKPFHSWPFFEKDETAAISGVLKSGKINYWTGEEGRLFEKEFAASIGAKYAVTVMLERVS